MYTYVSLPSCLHACLHDYAGGDKAIASPNLGPSDDDYLSTYLSIYLPIYLSDSLSIYLLCMGQWAMFLKTRSSSSSFASFSSRWTDSLDTATLAVVSPWYIVLLLLLLLLMMMLLFFELGLGSATVFKIDVNTTEGSNSTPLGEKEEAAGTPPLLLLILLSVLLLLLLMTLIF